MIILWMSRDKFEDMVRRIKLQAYDLGHADGRNRKKHRVVASGGFRPDMGML